MPPAYGWGHNNAITKYISSGFTNTLQIYNLIYQKNATSQQKVDRSSQNLAQWCEMGPLTALAVKDFEYKNPKMADGDYSEKPLCRNISTTVWPILTKYAKVKH